MVSQEDEKASGKTSKWVRVRQEIDGPQAEHLEFVPCGQILQDEDNSRREEKLSPAQVRDKETTYSSFSKSRRASRLHTHRKAP